MHGKYKQPRTCAYTHVYMPACSLEADWDIKHRITMNKSASERTKKKTFLKNIYMFYNRKRGVLSPIHSDYQNLAHTKERGRGRRWFKTQPLPTTDSGLRDLSRDHRPGRDGENACGVACTPGSWKSPGPHYHHRNSHLPSTHCTQLMLLPVSNSVKEASDCDR